MVRIVQISVRASGIANLCLHIKLLLADINPILTSWASTGIPYTMAILTIGLIAVLTAAIIRVSDAAPSPKSAITCPITLDGRVPQNTTLEAFDTTAFYYNPDYTKGQNLNRRYHGHTSSHSLTLWKDVLRKSLSPLPKHARELPDLLMLTRVTNPEVPLRFAI